jgi:hypothetical protein
VLAVGREVDKHTEVINLIQLMYQMTQRPKVISRQRFLKMLDLENPAIGEVEYLDVARSTRIGIAWSVSAGHS